MLKRLRIFLSGLADTITIGLSDEFEEKVGTTETSCHDLECAVTRSKTRTNNTSIEATSVTEVMSSLLALAHLFIPGGPCRPTVKQLGVTRALGFGWGLT